MKLQFTNTMSGKKEVFVPLVEGKVSFYLCGVTVYDHCHVGHARAYVVFDVIRRYLTHLGFDVTFIQNFTDIDDKIIRKAQAEQVPFEQITATYIDSYFEDMSRLNILPATLYPRATDYIDRMILMIEGLIDRGFAYVSGQDVCFSVSTFSGYGKLSKKVLEDLISGARVEVSDHKQDPLDFVLWKGAKEGEPFWMSPWGKGRPGWHIECSAMATQELGDTIDIHAGGADLIFPHHENEIAQSECFTGHPFARYWMHNGFVTIHAEKMSKSLKNVVSIREALSRYSGDVLRFYLLRTQYRNPLHFSYEGLDEATQAYQRLVEAIKVGSRPCVSTAEVADIEAKFHRAMHDDFNSAEAIGYLFELAKVVNSTGQHGEVLKRLGELLGLFSASVFEAEVFSDEVMQLVQDRLQARLEKNFVRSDDIRDQLLSVHGVVIEDVPSGPPRLKRAQGATS